MHLILRKLGNGRYDLVRHYATPLCKRQSTVDEDRGAKTGDRTFLKPRAQKHQVQRLRLRSRLTKASVENDRSSGQERNAHPTAAITCGTTIAAEIGVSLPRKRVLT